MSICSKRSLAFFAALTVTALAPSADAALDVSTSRIKSYDLPVGFDAHAAIISSDRAGQTVLAATTGVEAASACVVIFADAERARSIEYRHDDEPTRCVGVTPAEGGFFLRGVNPAATPDQPSGFTAYIDVDANLRWVVRDRDLLAAEPESDGGTGEFLGVYSGPEASIAYSPELERVIAFTRSKFVIGVREEPVVQAHVVDVSTGRLSVSGQTFGSNGAGVVAGVERRDSDGYFLLRLFSRGERGADFFSYNGRQNIELWELAEDDWSDRVVQEMVWGPEPRMTLLWTETAEADSETHVSAVDESGALLWEQRYELTTSVPGLDEPVSLGRPLEMWAGGDYILVTYLLAERRYLRVIEALTGAELGVESFDALGLQDTISFVEAGDGRLAALSIEGARLVEDALDFEVRSEPDSPDMGAAPDMGGPLVIPDPGDVATRGCVAAPGQEHAPLGLIWLMLGLGWRGRLRRG